MLGQAPRTPGAVLVPKPAEAPKPPLLVAAPGTDGAEGSAPAPAATPDAAEANALVTGAAVPSKPGRADDFAWPQSATN